MITSRERTMSITKPECVDSSERLGESSSATSLKTEPPQLPANTSCPDDSAALIQAVNATYPKLMDVAKTRFIDGYTNHDEFICLVFANHFCQLEKEFLLMHEVKENKKFIAEAFTLESAYQLLSKCISYFLQEMQENHYKTLSGMITMENIQFFAKQLYASEKEQIHDMLQTTDEGSFLLSLSSSHQKIPLLMIDAILTAAKEYAMTPALLEKHSIIKKLFVEEKEANAPSIRLRYSRHGRASIIDPQFPFYDANTITLGKSRKVIASAAPRKIVDVEAFFDLIVQENVKHIKPVIDLLHQSDNPEQIRDCQDYFFSKAGMKKTFGRYIVVVEKTKYHVSETDKQQGRGKKKCLEILKTLSSDTLQALYPHMNRSAKFYLLIQNTVTQKTHRVIVHFHKTKDNTPPVNENSTEHDVEQFSKEYLSSKKELMLIHCAAGIGRTGFTVLLGFLLDEAETIFDPQLSAEAAADKIAEILRLIRQTRPLLVVTHEQYEQAIHTAKRIYVMQLKSKQAQAQVMQDSSHHASHLTSLPMTSSLNKSDFIEVNIDSPDNVHSNNNSVLSTEKLNALPTVSHLSLFKAYQEASVLPDKNVTEHVVRLSHGQS